LTRSGVNQRDTDAALREQWRSFLRNIPRAATANFAAATLFTGAAWFDGAGALAIAWLVAAGGANAARWLLLRLRGRRAAGAHGAARSRRLFIGVTTLTGAVWGLGFALLLPGSSFSLQILAVGFVAGLGAVSMLTVGAIWPAFLGFALPAVLPLAGVLAIQATVASIAMGLSVLIATVVITLAARDLNRKMGAVLVAQRVNRRLIGELAEARDRAEASARAKSDFLATMSHEIRTPMNGVLGMAELLAKTPLNASQQGYVDSLHKSGQVLLNLINDILDVSKIESGKFELGDEAFGLHALMDGMEQMFAARAAEKGLTLTFRTTPAVDRAYSADPTRLQQILMNLIGNAIKFTERGEVRVTAEADPESPLDTGTFNTKETRVRFTVADTGTGIPADKLNTIFGAFDQADGSRTRRYGGTGLGLHIARKLAGLMGGDIDVTSEEGAGSTFIVRLPLAHAEHPAAVRELPPSRTYQLSGASLGFEHPSDSSSEAAPAPVERRRPSVLLAEDNPVNQQVAEVMLNKLGCEVVTVANGEDALYSVVSAPDRFDLVLMDCDMPTMDGFDATRRLRERGFTPERLPIIALTASAMAGDRQRCIAAGMTGYVSKPVSQGDLEEVLRDLPPERGGGGANTAPVSAEVTSHKADATKVADVLDAATVAQLRGLQQPGAPNVFEQLAERFVASSEKHLEQLETAARDNDPATIRRAAHSLKSSSASVGATTLAEHFARIEAAGVDTCGNEARQRLPHIRRLMDDVYGALRTLGQDWQDHDVTSAIN
jgi:signal transduction histidine kinase/DNA-binding NarL/FixJ family response regulator